MSVTKLNIPEDYNYTESVKEMHLEMIDKMYWIDIVGKLHKYKGDWNFSELGSSLHYLIADALFPDVENPEDYLYDLNWIAIGSDVYGNRIKHPPNQAQINRLDKLGIKVKVIIKD